MYNNFSITDSNSSQYARLKVNLNSMKILFYKFFPKWEIVYKIWTWKLTLIKNELIFIFVS